MYANTAGCLGKVPNHGDFVRHRASTPTMRAFDEWLRKGLYHARQHERSDWKVRYDQAPSIRFLFWGDRPQAPNALLGVLRPSRDKSGRTYPFLVTCELPADALMVRHLPHLPVRATSFYKAAEAVVARATAGDIPYEEIPTVVEEMEPKVALRPTVPREHRRYLKNETLGTYLEAIFGHFDGSEKYRLFSNLLDVLLPLQNGTPIHLNYGLEFPLHPNSERRIDVASFWLDLVLRILDYPPIHPSVFWTEPEDKAESSRMDLFLDAPEPTSLFGILAPSRANGQLYLLRVEGEKSPADAALSIPERYGTLLDNEQIRLWDFLRRL